MITIDKGFPIPQQGTKGRHPKWQILYTEMQVGDSVLITTGQAIALTKAAKVLGGNVRQSSRDCENGFTRVWRIS